jgi:ArsR family transcriptional regulator
MSHIPSTSYTDSEIRLARYARALGHPARIVIMNYLLSLDACCFSEILKELPIAQATVSQHLKELKNAGLIQGNVIPPKVKYCINRENWAQAQQLLGDFIQQKTNV